MRTEVMKIEIRPLDQILPYEKNARKIPQRAIDKVAVSLEEFGWQQPIVVDKHGVIIVGHVRRLAALQLGWTEAPVHVADKLTPAQIRAYRLMDIAVAVRSPSVRQLVMLYSEATGQKMPLSATTPYAGSLV